MSSLRQFRRVLITALAVVFLCGMVAAEDSTRPIRATDHEDKGGRYLAVAWTRPTYWTKYQKLFTLKRLHRCVNKNGMPPTSGSRCSSPKIGWYTCLFGEQTCKATPGALPGRGKYVGATLGTKHPAIRCDCEASSWTCYDWDICVQDVVDPPGVNNVTQCPVTEPRSGDTCPSKLADTAVCGYGTVSCCNGPPITQTKCSCTTGGTFECRTIAVDCGRCRCDDGKTSWPELVGTPGTNAKAVIEKEVPCLTQVVVLPEGSPVIKDLRLDRVWIFVDDKGDVVVIPKIG